VNRYNEIVIQRSKNTVRGSAMEDSKDKSRRVLDIYSALMDGKIVNKREIAQKYGVNERSIQRDFEEIRTFLDDKNSETGCFNELVYDRGLKGYRMEYTTSPKLSNGEVLAISKILLDSRAFTKCEIHSMLQRLVDCCVPKDSQRTVAELIRNEEYHYVELQHKTVFIDKLWEIGQAISKNKYIEINYQRSKDYETVKRKLKPVAIMFSEFYFYVAAFIDEADESRKHFDVLNDTFPTIYRIDRIRKLKVLDEHFYVPYKNRFEEGEFRKRIQFMYGGKLQKVRFKCKDTSIEAVLDRLPTAQILSEEAGEYVVSAEVFGKGIDMWLRSQGDAVKLI